MSFIREFVDTPRLLPAPFGLVNGKTLVNTPGSDTHWENGFTYEITSGGIYGKTHDSCNYAATQGASVGNAPGSAGASSYTYWRDYAPLSLEASYICRTAAGMSVDERKKRAADALDLLTSKLLEQELWANNWANTENAYGNRAFNNSSAVLPIGSTAVKLRLGLAALENAIGQEGPGAQGAIHVTRDVLSLLRIDMSGIQDRDGIMYTPAGNMLIGGTGYPGTGPSGQARTNTTAWMYATGPVAVRLGAINVNDVPSKLAGPVGTESYSTTNTLVFTAERAAAVTFNSQNVYAVLVDLTL